MALISGCQEGKGTPRLVEVKCPACGEYVKCLWKWAAISVRPEHWYQMKSVLAVVFYRQEATKQSTKCDKSVLRRAKKHIFFLAIIC